MTELNNLPQAGTWSYLVSVVGQRWIPEVVLKAAGDPACGHNTNTMLGHNQKHGPPETCRPHSLEPGDE